MQFIRRETVAEAQIERFCAVDCLVASAALSGVPRAILRMVLVGASAERTVGHFTQLILRLLVYSRHQRTRLTCHIADISVRL